MEIFQGKKGSKKCDGHFHTYIHRLYTVHKPNLYKDEWWSFITERNYQQNVWSEMTQKGPKGRERQFFKHFSKSRGEGDNL